MSPSDVAEVCDRINIAWPSENRVSRAGDLEKKEHEKRVLPRPDGGVIVGMRSGLKAWVKTVIQFFLVPSIRH